MVGYNSFSDHFSEQYLNLLLEPNSLAASTLVKKAVTEAPTIIEVYKGIEKAMGSIGVLWQKNKITIAEEHHATSITQECLVYCYQHISSRAKTKKNRSVISFTAEKELHDVGIKMVNHLMEYHGFNVTYLGNNLPIEDAVAYIKKSKPEIVAISMTLYTHFPYMNKLVQIIKSQLELSHIKIIIGGYGFRHNLALLDAIQYDYYAENIDELLHILETI